jgi:hypothetical protein
VHRDLKAQRVGADADLGQMLRLEHRLAPSGRPSPHTGSSIPIPANQRNSRLEPICSINYRSACTEQRICNRLARISRCGGIEGRPREAQSPATPPSRLASASFTTA